MNCKISMSIEFGNNNLQTLSEKACKYLLKDLFNL